MLKRGNEPPGHALYLRCSTDDQAQGDFTTIRVTVSGDVNAFVRAPAGCLA